MCSSGSKCRSSAFGGSMVVKLHCLHLWGSFIPEKHSHSKALELLEHHSQGLPTAGSPERDHVASGTSANPPLPCLVKAAAVLQCAGGTRNKPTSLSALWRRKGGKLYNLRAVIERVC